MTSYETNYFFVAENTCKWDLISADGCHLSSSQRPSVARTRNRFLAGVDSDVSGGRRDIFRWVTTGRAVTYGGVLKLGGGGLIGILLPIMNALFKLQEKPHLISPLFVKQKTYASCTASGHLYRASPNAREGSKPPKTRPSRITVSASSLGCSDRILIVWKKLYSMYRRSLPSYRANSEGLRPVWSSVRTSIFHIPFSSSEGSQTPATARQSPEQAT